MIRLFFAVFLLLFSLLVIFRAPTNFFWRVSVAVTEFPWIFMLSALVLFVSCFWADNYKLASLSLTAIAFLIYCYPVLKAYQRGVNLPAGLQAIFPAAQNSNRLAAPFSFFKMFSGIVPEEFVPREMIYKKFQDKNLALDFYSDNTPGKMPCVIVIHGGSWSEGDMKQLPALNSYLAAQHYRVAAISYRLAPEFKSPAPIEDTRDVIQFLSEKADELKIDTNNFILLGRSAGGQIALVAAYCLHDPHIRGVVSFYGPADMVWGAKIKGNPWVLNTEKVFADYLGGTYEQFPEKYHESSSCEYVNANSPATLIIHGEMDPMVSFHHGELLQQKLNAFHVKNYFLDLPAATHGCDYNLSGPSGQLTTYAVERFIAGVVER